MIPKIIHQTHRNMPKEFALNADLLRQRNLDYAYRFWSDADILDFIRDTFEPEIFSAYQRINPKYGAARADLFRYLCIHTYGGAYFDIKSNASEPLSWFLTDSDRYILGQWPDGGEDANDLAGIPGGEYQQWHVIAEARHPFLEAVITRVIRNIRTYDADLHGVGKNGTLRLTGPIAYTQAIHPILADHPHRFVDPGLLVYREIDHVRVMMQTATHYAYVAEPIVL